MTRPIGLGLHRPKGVEREENDFYATDPKAVEPLLKILGFVDKKLIWENSCGQGHLSKPLKEAGHTVISTDLIDRGYGVSNVNFLKESWFDTLPYDAVIMNPPYKHALEFVEKAICIAPVVASFLRIQFLESEKRAKFFKINPPKFVAVFKKRIPCSKNALFPDGESSAVCYAWFVWERGFKGDPIIKSI